jgi:diguanylate cyclase (GGDEF)-like protein/PAS domain S-box-containing protein
VTFVASPPGAPSVQRLADPILAVDQRGILRYANDTAADVLHWDLTKIVKQPFVDLVHPDDVAAANALIQLTDGGSIDSIELRVRTGGDGWAHLEMRGTHELAGDEQLVVLVARDVTDRHLLDFDRGDVEVLRAVMGTMHNMVILVDGGCHVRSINGAVTRLLGMAPVDSFGRPFADLLHLDDRLQVVEAFTNLAPGASMTMDARFVNSAGDHTVCEFTVTNQLDDPVVRSYVISAQVATALADARDRVEFLAEHDNRTGLLNRDGFMRIANELIEQGGGIGILVIDVVQFRSINELYGEPVGDAVLAAVADRIDKIRWPDLITARFGGDEFVLAVRSRSDSVLEMLRERARRDVVQPILVDGNEVNIAIRTATAWEASPRALDSLLATASNELMSVKRNADPETGGISFDTINERRQQLEQLRRALSNGEIQPFFQPVVDDTGAVTAVEALVRWVHPVRGVLGVGHILPLAQMAGLSEAVDTCVLEQSVAFASRLAAAGYGHVSVHVNVNPKLISQPAFGTTFLDHCRRAGAEPSQMVVEITETDLLAPGAASLANMQQLRFAGIHVSIDDFGTGYSSLAHLLELPVDGMKIDRRFVAGIDVDVAATNLTTAIIGLSESLNLACVAEGVEQRYQLDRLIELGCTQFQGWLFSAAVSAEEAMQLLPRIDLSPPLGERTDHPHPSQLADADASQRVPS